MIQVLPGVLLNSSTKMWYSLGRVKVRGKKSHLAASERPASLSKFFRSRLRFFTVRFFRVSWNVKQTKIKRVALQFSEQVTAPCYYIVTVNYPTAFPTETDSPHNCCESGLFWRAPPCRSDQNTSWATPHHTSWSPTLHHCQREKERGTDDRLTGWRPSNYQSAQIPLTLWPPPSLASAATHQQWCWWAHTCNAHTALPWGGWRNILWVSGRDVRSKITDHFKHRLTVPQFWHGHLCLCAQTPAGVEKRNRSVATGSNSSWRVIILVYVFEICNFIL